MAGMIGTAVISDDGAYRYRLERTWGSVGSTVTFVMLNPSTADADLDDPTIRRCVGFAKRVPAARLTVVNLYALRATDPDALREAAEHGTDPFGPDNPRHLHDAIHGSRLTIVAWGAWGEKLPMQRLAVNRLIGAAYGRPLWCLGTTKSGAPRHPLYLKADAPLVPWRPTYG